MNARISIGLAGLAACVAVPSFAQTKIDRRAIPPAGTTPALRIPTWTKSTLSNGAQLVVSEKHALPLVSVTINFIGGSNQFEPADKAGLATLTAQMMSEGTTTRSGDQIVSGFQMLGANLGVSVRGESGVMALQVTADKLAPALALTADVLLHPTFPAAALDRLRGQMIVGLTQSRDRTEGIASAVYPKLLYATNHPYAKMTTETTLRGITRDDIAAFHHTYFEPGRAVITVVGDVKADAVKAELEKTFAGWAKAGSVPNFSYPSVPASRPRGIFIVDKPGAAQSTFAVGEIGPPRNTPDYYAVRVMNAMLGELFQSRLNHNIREVKGYSYGVSSRFSFGRGPGPFIASGNIVTAKTDSALIEFMKELNDIRGPRPPSDDELAQAKASLVQSLPAAFASVEGVNRSVSSIYVEGLPDDYFQQFARAVNAVTKDDVVRAASKYINPEHLTILIVGDRSKIEGPLTATKIAPVTVLDVNGDPITTKVTP
ncbi:MAG TPA: pitrilysin family protein [Gemmatimonadaceae bacterium]|jgi:zinc protease